MDKFINMKEKSDMILEPLQVMIQLALLSHSPIGTKLSISENLLHIQQPSWNQGMWRWYMKDNKDDLYYLFQAIRRFYMWYKPENCIIYAKILETAIVGLNRLQETYENTDKISIKHTLSLYTNILKLETPDLFKGTDDHAINIDNVFKNITSLYNKKNLAIIFNIFKLLEEETNEENKKYLMDGLLLITVPTNNKIKGWIRENLTC
tara:strand:- start:1194 stop:1814 length:621 start_codon:yes stop_codon:yes gene_type:complete